MSEVKRWVAGFGHQHAFRVYEGSLDGPIVANCNVPGGVSTGLEAQRNTELIAAAPDLFHALEELEASLSFGGYDLEPERVERACTTARKVLAKAKGNLE